VIDMVIHIAQWVELRICHKLSFCPAVAHSCSSPTAYPNPECIRAAFMSPFVDTYVCIPRASLEGFRRVRKLYPFRSRMVAGMVIPEEGLSSTCPEEAYYLGLCTSFNQYAVVVLHRVLLVDLQLWKGEMTVFYKRM
jgi:hypothetical protein